MQSKWWNSFFIFIAMAIIVTCSFLDLSTSSLKAADPVKLSVFPAEGSRTGGESIQIQGGPFTASALTVVRPASIGGSYTLNIPVVRFGDNNNLEDPADDALLTTVTPRVSLAGGITAAYKPGPGTLELSIVETGLDYRATYNYVPGSPIMINTKDLFSGSTFYPHEELIRISDDGKYLYMETGIARWASIRSDNSAIIELKTPSYYTIGDVELLVQNSNSDEFKAKFKYDNPLSNPQISNILREGQHIAAETINNTLVRLIRVNYKGGNTITVVGTDFKDNLKIKLGDLSTIDGSNIDAGVSGQISFTVPAADKENVGSLIPLELLNEDGGLALSTELTPPVFLQYTQGDISPVISKISTNQGFSCGGNMLTIEGLDFRREGEIYGFTGKPLVSFGGVKVPDSDVRIVNSTTIELRVPANTPGKINIAVENPDGEIAVLTDAYTYISMPKITSVLAAATVASSQISNVSINGGQELTIKGSQFMSGAKVIFAPGEPQALTTSDSSTDFIYLARDTSQALQNCRFTYQGGTEVSDSTYIDSNTIKVKAPAGKLDSAGIMIVNPDAGASEIYKDISYSLEELSAVTGVIAELLYDRSIKIHWNPVAQASYYEVYVRADNGNLEILGTTSTNSMVFENYKDHTRYRFVVKARGDYVVSLPSQSSNEIYAYQAGINDSDGELDAQTTIRRSGSQLLIRIGMADNYAGLMPVNLNQGQLAGVKEIIISLPADLISSYRAEDIVIIGSDYRLRFNPRIFNRDFLSTNGSSRDTGVRFKIMAVPDTSSGSVAVLSKVYQFTAGLYTANEQKPLEYLAGNIQFDLNYSSGRAITSKLKTIRSGRWDESENHWANAMATIDSVFNQASFSFNRLGSYAVVGERR